MNIRLHIPKLFKQQVTISSLQTYSKLSSMDPNIFYGSKRRKLENVENKSKYFHDNPIPDINKGNILSDYGDWKIFLFQNDAINYCEQTGMETMVFSNENKKGNGSRNYVVAHPKWFWKIIMKRPLERRCSYELIVQNHPSKLYFDLEFNQEYNKNLNGIKTTNLFIKIINFYIRKEFQIDCSYSDILNLDSSTEKKFSKHLIYDKVIFENNNFVGNFVKYVCTILECAMENKTDIDELSLSYSDIKDLWVYDSKGNYKIFCDKSVYTKNRNFRLFKCTKYGKNSPLEVAADNSFVPEPDTEEGIYLSSLITNVPHKCRELTFGNINLPGPVKNTTRNSSVGKDGFSKSPYTEIDDFIQSIIGSGSIRFWKYFDDTQTLMYDIKNYRYCHNIGREHKSNGIMYIVNLNEGNYYQKCYDTDCKGFKSEKIPLPLSTMPWKLFEDLPEKENI